jgi:hypothetical protein
MTLAAVPKEIVYQGLLVDKYKNVFPDGSYQIVFNIYDDSLPGVESLFADTQSVEVKQGIFSVAVGSKKAGGINLPFDKQYWMSITYKTNELTPRLRLSGAAYAARAAVADSVVKVGSTISTDSISIRNITGTKIGIGTIIDNGAKIASSANQSDFNIVLKNDLPNSKNWYMGSSGNGWSSGAGKFILGRSTIASQADLTIDSAGQVGIGTTNPSYLLDVSGSGSQFISLSASIASGLRLATTGSDSADWFFQTTDRGSVLSGGLRLYNGLKGLEAFRIDTNCNIGIGTIAPFALLHIKNAANTTGLLVNTTNSLAPIAQFIDETSSDCNISVGGTPGGIFSKLGSTAHYGYVGTYYANPFAFVTANTERMRIDGAGNVGIGTKTPNYSLVVAGDGRSDGTKIHVSETTKSAAVTMSTPNTALIVGVDGDAGGELLPGSSAKQCIINSVGVYPILFGTSNTERMRISSSGNVGIGVTNPAYKLEINGSSSDSLINNFNVSDASTINIENTDTTIGNIASLYLRAGSADCGILIQNRGINQGDIVFVNDTANKGPKETVRIKYTGNVGIGTSNPTEMLDVAGNIRATGTITPSDLRLKTNITPIPSALSKIESLQGVYYNWNREKYPERNFSDEKQIGLIAQDVEKVIPEVVHTDAEGYKSMSYDKLTAVLIEAVKEQQKIIKEQKATIDDLSKRVNILENR